MKKIFALVLAIAMVATCFAACGSAEAEYKLGMGVDVTLDSSKDGLAQADATVATVILDKDGKIVAADLDVAQIKVKTENGKLDLAAVELRTKKEQKEDYNMKGVSASMGNIEGGAEWYEQAEAFVKYCIGKTADEVKAIKTEVKNDHNVAVDADLYAGCTMDISAFVAAFTKAIDDDQAKTFTAKADAFKLGLATAIDVSGSTEPTADKAGTAQLYATFSSAAVDADGKVLAAIVDAIQPSVTFDAAGVVGEKKFDDTKRVLKEGYNMKGVSASYGNIEGGAEWYEQAEAYTDLMVGKTAADIKAIETKESNGHNVAADADIFAACTMDITAFIADMAKAVEAAK